MQVGLTQLQVDMYASILTGNDGIASMLYNQNILQQFNPRKLNNILMQLRKVCNHPYMFQGTEPQGAEEFGEHII